METLLELFTWLWNNATPKLTLVTVMVIAVLQYYAKRQANRTARTLAEHLNPKNKYPHPECEWGDKSYEALTQALENQRKENREDHQIIFELLRNGKEKKHES